MTDTYHPTLAAALDAVAAFAADRQAVVNTGFAPSDSWRGAFQAMSYENSQRHSFELLSLRGKETAKCLVVSIYRMDSGTYELNCYIF